MAIRINISRIVENKVKKALDIAVSKFAYGLISSPDHPVVTGITRGNWHPSVGMPINIEDTYGFSWSDIYDAYEANTMLVGSSGAFDTSSRITYKIGDVIFWTNSLEHIKDLEHKRKFFDLIVHNAVQEANRAGRR